MCCNHHEILWRLVQAISSMRSVEIHFSEFGRLMGDRIKIVHVCTAASTKAERLRREQTMNESGRRFGVTGVPLVHCTMIS